MNRRTLKKHCKRAMAVLIEKHGYNPGSFKPADGDESMYAPPSMERRHVETYGGETRWLRPGPLRGTPLLWERTSYEYDEWDCKLPSEVLDDIESWENMSEEDFARLCAQEPGL